MGYHVRSMRAEDIPELVSIDRETFPTQWPPTSFKRELSNRMAHYLVVCPEDEQWRGAANPSEPNQGILRRLMDGIRDFLGMRRADNGDAPITQDIAGYVAFWMMADEAHITSIAVRTSLRGQGVGELLLIAAIDLASKYNASVMTLEVRESNYSAQSLYEKYGFCRVGSRRAYYSDDKEDAVIMTTEPITTQAYWARFQRLKHDFVLRRGAIIASYVRQQLLEPRTSQDKTGIRGCCYE